MFFHWLGIVYSCIFGLIGFCLIVGLLADHCWKKMQNAYGFAEIMIAYKKYNKEKREKTNEKGRT